MFLNFFCSQYPLIDINWDDAGVKMLYDIETVEDLFFKRYDVAVACENVCDDPCSPLKVWLVELFAEDIDRNHN